ncbi:hypothetical protein J5N97_014673 [Dioscorea zingiberensis]|uniref:Uncharacterized protein n=1 Tax=Dioscorea zingiberensis TaxID=325984 RepID=A0A9D5CUK7_9LILI|nr:hypothetical protein J5N97_014673 [Dioscorea zingiberensis]
MQHRLELHSPELKARLPEQTPEQGAGLGGADGGGGVEPRGGEEVNGDNAADVAPMGALGGGAEGGVVVGEEALGVELWTVGEDDVELGEALGGDGEGGDDKDSARAEVEEHDGAMASCELLES